MFQTMSVRNTAMITVSVLMVGLVIVSISAYLGIEHIRGGG